MIIAALAELGKACLHVFVLKRESVGPPFVLNRDSGALPQFSGSWLTSKSQHIFLLTCGNKSLHP